MTCSIMVVDDDEPILEMMGILLQKLGYEPRLCADGLAGLREVKDNLPSLILLDVMMTPINGWEFLMRLRAGEKTRRIPVLLFSAHPSVEEKVAQLNDPYLSVLLKPVSLAELDKGIHRFLPPR